MYYTIINGKRRRVYTKNKTFFIYERVQKIIKEKDIHNEEPKKHRTPKKILHLENKIKELQTKLDEVIHNCTQQYQETLTSQGVDTTTVERQAELIKQQKILYDQLTEMRERCTEENTELLSIIQQKETELDQTRATFQEQLGAIPKNIILEYQARLDNQTRDYHNQIAEIRRELTSRTCHDRECDFNSIIEDMGDDERLIDLIKIKDGYEETISRLEKREKVVTVEMSKTLRETERNCERTIADLNARISALNETHSETSSIDNNRLLRTLGEYEQTITELEEIQNIKTKEFESIVEEHLVIIGEKNAELLICNAKLLDAIANETSTRTTLDRIVDIHKKEMDVLQTAADDRLNKLYLECRASKDELQELYERTGIRMLEFQQKNKELQELYERTGSRMIEFQQNAKECGEELSKLYLQHQQSSSDDKSSDDKSSDITQDLYERAYMRMKEFEDQARVSGSNLNACQEELGNLYKHIVKIEDDKAHVIEKMEEKHNNSFEFINELSLSVEKCDKSLDMTKTNLDRCTVELNEYKLKYIEQMAKNDHVVSETRAELERCTIELDEYKLKYTRDVKELVMYKSGSDRKTLQKLKDELAELKNQYIEQTNKMSRNEHMFTELGAVYGKLLARSDVLITDLSVCNTTLSELTGFMGGDTQKIKNAIKSLETLNRQHRVEIENLERLADEAQQTLLGRAETCQAELQKVKRIFQERMNVLEQNVSELTRTNIEIRDQLTKSTKQNKTLSSVNRELFEKNQQLESEFENIEEMLKECDRYKRELSRIKEQDRVNLDEKNNDNGEIVYEFTSKNSLNPRKYFYSNK